MSGCQAIDSSDFVLCFSEDLVIIQIHDHTDKIIEIEVNRDHWNLSYGSGLAFHPQRSALISCERRRAARKSLWTIPWILPVFVARACFCSDMDVDPQNFRARRRRLPGVRGGAKVLR